MPVCPFKQSLVLAHLAFESSSCWQLCKQVKIRSKELKEVMVIEGWLQKREERERKKERERKRGEEGESE
jgi:hypothetical protein